MTIRVHRRQDTQRRATQTFQRAFRRTFRHKAGHDFSLGPIITYGTRLGGKAPFSASLRWVPSISSTNRLKSTSTVMATATLAF